MANFLPWVEQLQTLCVKLPVVSRDAVVRHGQM